MHDLVFKIVKISNMLIEEKKLCNSGDVIIGTTY